MVDQDQIAHMHIQGVSVNLRLMLIDIMKDHGSWLRVGCAFSSSLKKTYETKFLQLYLDNLKIFILCTS